ncbi:MAG: hypothetical protein ABSF23_15240 [Terracidiphilus sp.]
MSATPSFIRRHPGLHQFLNLPVEVIAQFLVEFALYGVSTKQGA